jgi:DNA polymerase-3 subunit epsilon
LRLLARRGPAATAFRHSSCPAPDTPWREARWCALDLELTGLNPRKDVIIAVGAVPIEDGVVQLGQSFYSLVRTLKRSERAAVLLHKLLVADLEGAPVLEEVLERVFELLAGRVPVFHAAAVERAFLGPLFARHRVRLPDAADTEVLGRRLLRERNGEAPEWLSLEALAGVLGQPGELPHHALGDALATAQAFVALATHLDRIRPQTVGSLVQAPAVAYRLGRFGPA